METEKQSVCACVPINQDKDLRGGSGPIAW